MPFGNGFQSLLHFALFLQTFTVRLSEPSSGSTHHQCVYLLCEKDELLLATAKALREAMDMSSDAEYMPHLSLLYSSITKDGRYVSVLPIFFSCVNLWRYFLCIFNGAASVPICVKHFSGM